MLKRTAKQVHKLRVYLFALIVVIFFFELGLSPVDITKFVGSKVGLAVGMSVGVADNPFNKLAMQLDEKERKLEQKEEELSKREEALNKEIYSGNDILLLFSAGGIIVLFILISVNFYLDFKRKNNGKNQKNI